MMSEACLLFCGPISGCICHSVEGRTIVGVATVFFKNLSWFLNLIFVLTKVFFDPAVRHMIWLSAMLIQSTGNIGCCWSRSLGVWFCFSQISPLCLHPTCRFLLHLPPKKIYCTLFFSVFVWVFAQCTQMGALKVLSLWSFLCHNSSLNFFPCKLVPS